MSLDNGVVSRAIEIAKSCDIRSVAEEMGYSVIRLGYGRYGCKEYDSLKFGIKNSEWKWYRFAENDGGDTISFVQEYNGMNFIEAVDYLSNNYISRNCDANYQPKPKHIFPKVQDKPIIPEKPKKFIPPTESKDCSLAIDYLVNVRGLNEKVIRFLVAKGFIAQEPPNKYNFGFDCVVFKLFDRFSLSDDKKYIGAEKIGIDANLKYKRTQYGTAANSFFELKRGIGDTVVFFESTIDMLSFMQIYPPDNPDYSNARFISMRGLSKETIEKVMRIYHIPAQKVVIASDNDSKGNMLKETLFNEYPQMKAVFPPNGCKDFNDYIRQKENITIPLPKEKFDPNKHSKINKKTNYDMERK